MTPASGAGGIPPLLRGLFGALQSAAAARASTADVWSALRTAAGTWSASTSGTLDQMSPTELEQLGTGILRQQGIGAIEVNRARAAAGQWRAAHESLLSADPGAQITGRQIFTPPWSTTSQAGVASRFRLRVQWEVQAASGESTQVWGTYDLATPLTSLTDVLSQAGALVGKKPTSDIGQGAVVTGANDYTIEQV